MDRGHRPPDTGTQKTEPLSVLPVSSTGAEQIGWAGPTAPGSVSGVSSPADLDSLLGHLPYRAEHIGLLFNKLLLLLNVSCSGATPSHICSLLRLSGPAGCGSRRRGRREGVLGAGRGVARRREVQGALWVQKRGGTAGPVGILFQL